jgi:hypothetical protein
VLEEPGRGAFLVGLERVAADQLGQTISLVRGRALCGPHFVEDHRHALPRDLVSRLRSGQAAAENVNGLEQFPGYKKEGCQPSAISFQQYRRPDWLKRDVCWGAYVGIIYLQLYKLPPLVAFSAPDFGG